jgi:hypothetical protein
MRLPVCVRYYIDSCTAIVYCYVTRNVFHAADMNRSNSFIHRLFLERTVMGDKRWLAPDDARIYGPKFYPHFALQYGRVQLDGHCV